jgi:hypothetical protein
MNTPQENRINGHKNITILEKTKIMSLNNNAPPFLWTKAINIGYVQVKVAHQGVFENITNSPQ